MLQKAGVVVMTDGFIQESVSDSKNCTYCLGLATVPS